MIKMIKIYANLYKYDDDETNIKKRFINQLKKRGLPLTVESELDKVGDVILGCYHTVYWADGSPISERQKEIILGVLFDRCSWYMGTYYELHFIDERPVQTVHYGYVSGVVIILRNKNLAEGQSHDVDWIMAECKRRMTGSLLHAYCDWRIVDEHILRFYGVPYEAIQGAVEDFLKDYPLRHDCWVASTGDSVMAYDMKW